MKFLFTQFVDSCFIILISLMVTSSGLFAQINWTKDLRNPVLPVGSTGSWDALTVRNPAVLYVDNEYKMWFNGDAGGTSPVSIGYATSPDGFSWTRYNDPATVDPPFVESDPVLLPGPTASWDVGFVGHPEVFFDGGTYHMWFHGRPSNAPSAGMISGIGYATSPDGINWTKYDDLTTVNPPYADSDPVLKPGLTGEWDSFIVGPGVLVDGGDYKMWYLGSDVSAPPFLPRHIGYATSSDGISWIKHNDPVLSPQDPWEFVLSPATVIFYNNEYRMWYGGGPSGPNPRPTAIGYAYSPDGITWSKDPANPCLDVGPPGSWDADQAYGATVRMSPLGTQYEMWYQGTGQGFVQIGYASCPTVAVEPLPEPFPAAFTLRQNYPNPFNPSTTIEFAITKADFISLMIYNTLGEIITTLVEEPLSAGTYRYSWDAGALPSGLYFYRIEAAGYSTTRKMLLLR